MKQVKEITLQHYQLYPVWKFRIFAFRSIWEQIVFITKLMRSHMQL